MATLPNEKCRGLCVLMTKVNEEFHRVWVYLSLLYFITRPQLEKSKRGKISHNTGLKVVQRAPINSATVRTDI